MEDFQRRPLDDAKHGHDFPLFRLWQLLTIQILIEDAVVKSYRPSGTYPPLRVVPGE